MADSHNILIESPQGWPDYEIIDSGDGYKLERFGRFVLARPEPKALWSKSLSDKEWERAAHTLFVPGAGFGKAGKEDSGTWKRIRPMPDQWFVDYLSADKNAARLKFRLRLGLTSFKHVGVFPEQAPNWEWIFTHVKELKESILPPSKEKVLNLFAYTGAASLAARLAGAEVTHVDSVKQVVAWAKENQGLSGLSNIRWIIDDALKFVKREIRRGNKYNGLILDPPAYGHGPDGERWKLDELLFELLTECSQIVEPQHFFVVLNLYSNGYSALLADTLLKKAFAKTHPCRPDIEYSCGELVLKDKFGKVIPLSVFARMYNN